jgi:hypothetical protein
MMRKLVLKIKDRKIMTTFISFIFFLFGLVGSNNAQVLPEKNSGVDQEKVRNFEEYLNTAKSISSDYVLELQKLDISAAKSAYDNLSFEEKDYAIEFPFLDSWVLDQLLRVQNRKDRVQVSFIYNMPPEKQQMESEVWGRLLRNKNLNVMLDGEKVSSESLIRYSEKDFALFEVTQTNKGGFFSKPSFEVDLTTHEKYDEDFIFTRKKLNSIIARYSNGEEMIIPYFMIQRTMISDQGGRLVPNYPVNFLSIILEEIYNQDFDALLERSRRMDNAPGIWFYYKKTNGEEYKLFAKY